MTAIHEQLLQAVQARLQAITFAAEATWPDGSAGGSITDDVIVIRTTVRDLESDRPAMPCIVIGLTGKERINTGGGTNVRDEVIYSIAVCLFGKANQDQVTQRAVWLKWREQIVRACNNWRPDTVTECLGVTVEPDTTVPLGQWNQNLLGSAVVLQARCWETRGIT